MLFVLNIQMLYVKSEIKKVNVFRNNNSSNIKHMYDDRVIQCENFMIFFSSFFLLCKILFFGKSTNCTFDHANILGCRIGNSKLSSRKNFDYAHGMNFEIVRFEGKIPPFLEWTGVGRSF